MTFLAKCRAPGLELRFDLRGEKSIQVSTGSEYVQRARLATTPIGTPAARSRILKLHVLTAMIDISTTGMTDVIRKTLNFLITDLPHSSVWCLGFDGELISTARLELKALR